MRKYIIVAVVLLAAVFSGGCEEVQITPQDLQKITTEVDRVQPHISVVSTAVRDANYSNGDTITTLLEATRAGNIASVSFNPYAPIIEAGLGLALIVAGMFARRENKRANAANAKYEAHKHGVEKTMKDLRTEATLVAPDVDLLLYTNIGNARRDLDVK